MHPDPSGSQLSVLREALARIIDGRLQAARDGSWVDFCGWGGGGYLCFAFWVICLKSFYRFIFRLFQIPEEGEGNLFFWELLVIFVTCLKHINVFVWGEKGVISPVLLVR